jgi:hypothetical protein
MGHTTNSIVGLDMSIYVMGSEAVKFSQLLRSCTQVLVLLFLFLDIVVVSSVPHHKPQGFTAGHTGTTKKEGRAAITSS